MSEAEVIQPEIIEPEIPDNTLPESERWNFRREKSLTQLNLLSNVENLLGGLSIDKQPTDEPTSPKSKPKTFLRRGGGALLKKNRWALEQQVRRQKQTQNSNNKPMKTKSQLYKEKLMQEWRKKQKNFEEQKTQEKPEITSKTVKPSLPPNYKRPTKSAKFKQKNFDSNSDLEKDELKSNSFFESFPNEADNSKNNDEKNQVGVWKDDIPVKEIEKKKAPSFNIEPNFGRQNPEQPFRNQAYIPKYSHHYSSLTNQYDKNKHNFMKRKKMFHKQATVHTLSKRDRLAKKSIQRQNNIKAINLKKDLVQKEQLLENEMKLCKEKMSESKKMKQQSLEEFKKYQTMISEFKETIEKERAEFENYKKKEEKLLFLKKQELKKKERNIYNIPNRKERNEIEKLKNELNETINNHNIKEKKYKSEIERLKKTNQKLRNEKNQLKNQVQNLEKERLNSNNANNFNHKKIHQIQRPMTSQTVTIHSDSKIKEHKPLSYSVELKKPFKNHNLQNNVMISRNWINDHENDIKTDSETASEIEEITYDEESYDSEVSINEIQPSIMKKKECLPEIPMEYRPDYMSCEQMNSDVIKNKDDPIHRMQHPDGRIEQLYNDSSKLIIFPNGTLKYLFNNLYYDMDAKDKIYLQIIVKFPNGDIKKIFKNGCEVYYYASNDIIHVSQNDGIELFFFGNQQHEIHFPDKSKHIMFKDGTKKFIDPDGQEKCVFVD